MYGVLKYEAAVDVASEQANFRHRKIKGVIIYLGSISGVMRK